MHRLLNPERTVFSLPLPIIAAVNPSLSCYLCNLGVIHDRDDSFLPFDKVVESQGIQIVKTPPHTPMCNAFAERFVREARETLNNIIPLGANHFRRVLKTIEKHHNLERPHQGIENVIPIQFDYPDKPASPNEIGCRSSLGGMLNHYYLDKKAA